MNGLFVGSKDIYYQSHIMMDKYNELMDFIDSRENTEEQIYDKIKSNEYDYVILEYNPDKFKKSFKDIGTNIITHSGNTYKNIRLRLFPECVFLLERE